MSDKEATCAKTLWSEGFKGQEEEKAERECGEKGMRWWAGSQRPPYRSLWLL